MTLRAWLGGVLLRALLLTPLLLAAGYGARALPRFQPKHVALPPGGVDRIVVTAGGDSMYEIRDKSQIGQILRFLHPRRELEWKRAPADANPYDMAARFYRGPREVGWMAWGPGGFMAPIEDGRGWARLHDGELEELDFLMDREGYRAAMSRAYREGRLQLQQRGIMAVPDTTSPAWRR